MIGWRAERTLVIGCHDQFSTQRPTELDRSSQVCPEPTNYSWVGLFCYYIFVFSLFYAFISQELSLCLVKILDEAEQAERCNESAKKRQNSVERD